MYTQHSTFPSDSTFTRTLSIITVCRNNAEGLRKTINSVLRQDCKDYEFLIIDGASTDHTQDVLKEYKDRVDIIVFESDNGIYNAMNKGIRKASGEYCIFMNAGDEFYDHKVVTHFVSNKPTEDILSGMELCSFDGIRPVALRTPPDTIDFLYFMSQTLAHQATFIRRTLLLELPYREDYKIASDYIFFFEALGVRNYSYRRLNFFVSKFIMDGISSTQGNLSQNERIRYLSSVFDPCILQRLLQISQYDSMIRNIERKTLMGRVMLRWIKLTQGGAIIRDKVTILLASMKSKHNGK